MLENNYSKWHEMMNQGEKEGWGCLPSPPDPRDYPLARIAPEVTLPSSVRLDDLIMRIRNQGQCGTCAGKAVASAVSAGHKKNLSSLYAYGRSKQEDGIPDTQGTYLRVVNKIAYDEGIPPEEKFPYSLLKQCLNIPAIPNLKQEAAQHKVKAYARLWSLDEIKQALAARKMVVAAVWVTDSFMRWNGLGNIGFPSGNTYGAHAVVLCGYDDVKQAFRGVNSWGEGWGDKGFFWLSYLFCDVVSSIGLPCLMEAWAYEFDNAPQKLAIDLWIGDKKAVVNGKEVEIDVAPEIKDGRTLIPLRFVAEQQGLRVNYIASSKKIEIREK